MKLSKIQQDMENIIEIFQEHTDGLTTAELHEIFEKKYHTTRTQRTIKNRLNDLAAGLMTDVECQISHKGKHQLQDKRIKNLDHMIRHRDKLLSEEVLFNEEHMYMRLAMESIRELDNLSKKHHKSIEKRLGLSGIDSPYFIEKDNIETIDITNADVKDLKDAINGDYRVRFKYTAKSRKSHYDVEPYKLIIFDGIWYLYGKDLEDKETPYKTWRLFYIEDVEYEELAELKHNMDDDTIEETLAEAYSPNFNIEIIDGKPVIEKKIEVKIKIHAHMAHNFDHKAHLSGVTKEPTTDGEGNLYVTTKVNTLKDIDAEIKSWLPHIEILEPLSYKKSFEEELRVYLEGIL